MKLALLLTALTLVTGASFAGQPGARVTFNNKGQVTSVIRTPAATPAPATSCMSSACCSR